MRPKQTIDEAAPLLGPSPDALGRLSFSAELDLLFRASVPVACSYALQNSLQTLSVVVVGGMGAAELSTAAFSYMIAMCTVWTIALGGSSALDTLGSAAFTSTSSKPGDVGIILQRCFLLLFLLHLPFAVLWCFITPVLLALGQSEALSMSVQSFLRVLCLGAPAYIGFESVKKYLQVQGVMHASTAVLLVTSPLNVGLNYWLVFQTDLGLLGAPLATSITYWLSFGLICAYCKYVDGSQCWAGWDRRALTGRGLLQFLTLAVPGIFHVGTEWWAFEIVALVAGKLGELPLAAQAVIMTVDQIMNTLPMGIGVVASARIGNLLGSRMPRQAYISTHAAVLLATMLGSVILVALLVTRDSFGYLFSDDAQVVGLVAQVLPYVAAFQVADGMTQSSGGVLRGMGKQKIGAAVNLVAYYVLALPFGIWLAFNTSLGLAGLWIGQCAALFLVGFGQYLLVSMTNWDVEVDKAAQRLD